MSQSNAQSGSNRITCSGCDSQIRVPLCEPGAKFKCPRCGSLLIAPSPQSGPPPTASGKKGPTDGSENVNVRCPSCGAMRSVRSNHLGRNVTCGECLDDFVAALPAENKPAQPPDVAAPGKTTATNTTPNQNNPARDTMAFDDELESDVNLDEIFGDPRLMNAAGGGSLGDSTAGFDDGSYFPPIDEDRTNHRQHDEPANPTSSSSPASLGDELWPTADTAPTETYEFTATCPLCGTRLEATTEQIGEQFKCPDCYTFFVVRQPPPSELRRTTRASQGFDDDGDGELKLRDEPVAPQADDDAWPTLPTVSPAATPTREAPTDFPKDHQRNIAHELLDKARMDAGVVERERPTLPVNPLSHRLFAVFGNSSGSVQPLFLAIGLSLEIWMLVGGISMLGTGSPVVAFMSMALIAGSFVFGCAFGIGLAAHMLVVVRDTSNGRDTIEQWPTWSLWEYAGDGFYVAGALFFSIVPGYLVGQALVIIGLSKFFLFASMILTVVALFPIFLLSSLEVEMPFIPYSKEVYGSMRKNGNTWSRFYLYSGIAGIAGAACLALAIAGGCLLGSFGAYGAIVCLFVYCRLMGRLVWVCAEKQ